MVALIDPLKGTLGGARHGSRSAQHPCEPQAALLWLMKAVIWVVVKIWVPFWVP